MQTHEKDQRERRRARIAVPVPFDTKLPRPAEYALLGNLTGLRGFKNRILALRHLPSTASANNIATACPKVGAISHGIVYGPQAERKSDYVADQIREVAAGSKIMIVTSGMLRTNQFAELLLPRLSVERYTKDGRFREREIPHVFEGRVFSTALGAEVEKGFQLHDRLRPTERYHGLEAASEVVERVTAPILEFEKEYEGTTIVIIGHRYALSILEGCCLNQSAVTAWTRPIFEAGEIRELKLHVP